MHDRTAPAKPEAATGPRVLGFREVLLYPLQLPPRDIHHPEHWSALSASAGPWRAAADGSAGLDAERREQHYTEFVSFMPDVQRFLYGDETGTDGRAEPSPIRIFERDDVTAARVTLRAGDAPVLLAVERVELCFFYDVDLAFLLIEFAGADLALDVAQDLLFRLARAYPGSWDDDGSGAHCCVAVELLDAAGQVLAASDFADKARFVETVHAHRAAALAAHWEWLLAPLAPQHSAPSGALSYRLLEQERMPLLAWLAVDDPRAIARDDWVRLGLAAAPGRPGATPFGARYLDDFEARYCYDRFWDTDRGHDHTATRMTCSGYAFLMVGPAGSRRFADAGRGILAKFRHQYVVLGLIAHFHRAALLAFRDRLVDAMAMLRDYAPETVKRFKREIRMIHENFLRFTHRYWFREVSVQGPAHDIFERWVALHGTEQLFVEVRQEVLDMMDYLDSDGLRRQANSVVRLTVVTFFGLIGTVATGVLGMNVFDLGNAPVATRLAAFLLVFVPVAALTFYTAAKSQRLSEFLEAVSDRRLPLRRKLRALARVWRG